MAKLAAKDRKKVKAAEAVTGEFTPMPAGRYVATLSEVEERTSKAGNKYWNCTFTDIENMEGETQPGRLWYTVMLPIDKMPDDYKPGPKSKAATREEAWETYQALTAGKIKAFFEAFGYSEDSDTDEMLGEQVILQVGIETIQQGERTGQKTNRVNAIRPLGDHVAGGDDDGDEF